MTKPLKPWYAVATPHQDIRERRLEEAIFAANVWAVVQGTAPEVYREPDQFYRKTHMTVGLANILSRVASVLRGKGDAGDRIISLQTAFGGGKTHTLVALWHMAKHSQRLRESPDATNLRRVLGDAFPEKACNVAVFTNSTCDPTQGRQTPEGPLTRTLWGELAVQLGGRSLYDRVRANDETHRVPQGLFVQVLRAAVPCLILLDELADYCVGAAAVPVGDTTLADQTISFIQQLTEAVQQVPGAVVVATLPASKYEVAQSEKGQEAFVTLEKRFQRLGADIKPVADDEIYDVVRTRLFESVTQPDEPEYPKIVAQAYHTIYTAHADEVPTEATKTSYRDEIERAYPFHPLFFDALYTRWGSHPDFQRTRGVLRLLASVVGDLWQRRNTTTESQHLIQPSHIRWSIDAMQAALTRLWGPAYQSVAAADIVGDKANATIFDEERGGDYRRERIGQGLASAMLLGSFGGQAQRSGFSTRDIKLACARQGVNWNYVDGALLELETRCFYLHSAAAGSLGKRYWFGTKPTLTKLLVQYRQKAASDTFDDDIIESLRDRVPKSPSGAAAWRVIVNPEPDLPEQKTLALLLLPPNVAWGDDDASRDIVKQCVLKLSARCGAKDRIYRNTLVFLAPSLRALNKLRQARREHAALAGIKSDYGDQLDQEQKDDIKKRLDAAERASIEALGPAYTVALRVHGQDVESTILADAKPALPDHLEFLWSTLVQEEEWILSKIGAVVLENTGLVPKDKGMRVKDAIDAFLRFTDKPIIASKTAVTASLGQACADGLIGIGRGANPSTLQTRYCKHAVSIDPTEDGVWIIPPFDPTPPAPGPQPSTLKGPSPDPTPSPSPHPPPPGSPQPPTLPRAVRRLTIRGSVPQESWADVFRCFVSPAIRMPLKKLTLGINFELDTGADSPLPQNDPTLKALREAAKQLGLSLDESE